MPGPNFLLETVGPQQDATSQAALAGIEAGKAEIEAARQRVFHAGENAKARASQEEQSRLQRMLQDALSRRETESSQQRDMLGANRALAEQGQPPPQMQGPYSALNAPLQQRATTASVDASADAARKMPAIQLGMTRERGGMAALSDDALSAGPPSRDMLMSSALDYSLGVQRDAARGMMMSRGTPLGAVDAVAPNIRTHFDEPPDPNADLKRRKEESEIERNHATAGQKRRWRPTSPRGVQPPDRVPLIVTDVQRAEQKWNEYNQELRSDFEEARKLYARKRGGARLTPAEQLQVNDAAAAPLLDAWLKQNGEVWEAPPSADGGWKPGSVATALLERTSRTFNVADETKKRTQVVMDVDAEVRRIQGPSPQPKAKKPPRDRVEFHAREIAKKRNISWDQLTSGNLPDDAQSIMDEAKNRAANE